MSETIRANTGTMSEKSATFNQLVTDVQDVLQAVTAALNDLEADWASNASVSFQTFMQTWTKDTTAINDQLQYAATELGKSANAYVELDSSIGKSFTAF